MYKTRLLEPTDGSKPLPPGAAGYVEMDPSCRYGRFRDILGKGAMKTVYKAFDELMGMEVAWSQVKLSDVVRSADELQRLYSEVHLLNKLNHPSIMRFFTSWIDSDRRTFNFITEMFTSGTLREYRHRHQRMNIRAVKNWARQVLNGLVYLHSLDPPVIHRDLKCDNIFVNGHLGQVKIGDLGLAAILSASQHAHSVIGTPEFMAPELYEEEYNELVDIYSFGMCVLEMLTSEYPYSECSNPAQIYKKVTTGKLPDAFFRIQDHEAQQFIGKCLKAASMRPSASELLKDSFLSLPPDHHRHLLNKSPPPAAAKNLELYQYQELSTPATTRSPNRRSNSNIRISGTLNPEDDTIFLRVHISDKNGQVRNIYFPFNIDSDTAVDVASEMVKELDITEWEPHQIAEMIDEEISALLPDWKQQWDGESFDDNEDDENDENQSRTSSVQHPFYYPSSHSSSHVSLHALFTSSVPGENNHVSSTSCPDWLQEDLLMTNDDDSSQSSLNSYKYYSNACYCSLSTSSLGKKQDKDNKSTIQHDSSCKREEERPHLDCLMRFFPPQAHDVKNKSYMHEHCKIIHDEEPFNLQQQQQHEKRMMMMRGRSRSFVDMRSQLLKRLMAEEISKRRLFKTVGAVENVGYHEPW